MNDSFCKSLTVKNLMVILGRSAVSYFFRAFQSLLSEISVADLRIICDVLQNVGPPVHRTLPPRLESLSHAVTELPASM